MYTARGGETVAERVDVNRVHGALFIVDLIISIEFAELH
jgi:hypothetical protein